VDTILSASIASFKMGSLAPYREGAIWLLLLAVPLRDRRSERLVGIELGQCLVR
jgi:hypothetical protein